MDIVILTYMMIWVKIKRYDWVNLSTGVLWVERSPGWNRVVLHERTTRQSSWLAHTIQRHPKRVVHSLRVAVFYWPSRRPTTSGCRRPPILQLDTCYSDQLHGIDIPRPVTISISNEICGLLIIW
jgi:hypothetical protein